MLGNFQVNKTLKSLIRLTTDVLIWTVPPQLMLGAILVKALIYILI